MSLIEEYLLVAARYPGTYRDCMMELMDHMTPILVSVRASDHTRNEVVLREAIDYPGPSVIATAAIKLRPSLCYKSLRSDALTTGMTTLSPIKHRPHQLLRAIIFTVTRDRHQSFHQ